jgi:hypothetical protein
MDLTWTPDGTLWAVTSLGQLYQRQGDLLVSRSAAIPNNTNRQFFGIALTATSSGKLRLVYSGPEDVAYVVTVDPGAGLSLGTPLQAPAFGAIWTNDETHALVATRGSVLRHGY